MDENIIIGLGLDKTEVKVYLALLEIGTSATGEVVKKSGVPSSRIYNVLNNLKEKGLVSYTLIKNTKYFKAHNPSRLKDLLTKKRIELFEKEKSLISILPDLEQKYRGGREKESENEQRIQTFDGIAGIKTALENVLSILKKGEEFIVFGAPKIGNEKLHGFFNEFHKERAKKGINYRVIYDYDAKEFGEERKKFPLTKVKYLSKELTTPSAFWIFNEYVALVVFSDKPIVLIIKNKKITESFMIYFELIWRIAKK